MERNVQRSVFLTTQLKGLYVVLSFMAHLDNAAVGQKSSGLVLRSAAEDTGDCVHVYLSLSDKNLLKFSQTESVFNKPGMLQCLLSVLSAICLKWNPNLMFL